VLTQVSVDGSFLGGLPIFGLGMSAAFVAGSIASLAGRAGIHEAVSVPARDATRPIHQTNPLEQTRRST
jgi:hypothetical protein